MSLRDTLIKNLNIKNKVFFNEKLFGFLMNESFSFLVTEQGLGNIIIYPFKDINQCKNQANRYSSWIIFNIINMCLTCEGSGFINKSIEGDKKNIYSERSIIIIFNSTHDYFSIHNQRFIFVLC